MATNKKDFWLSSDSQGSVCLCLFQKCKNYHFLFYSHSVNLYACNSFHTLTLNQAFLKMFQPCSTVSEWRSWVNVLDCWIMDTEIHLRIQRERCPIIRVHFIVKRTTLRLGSHTWSILSFMKEEFCISNNYYNIYIYISIHVFS